MKSKLALSWSSVAVIPGVVVALASMLSATSAGATPTSTTKNQPFTITSPDFTNYGPLPTTSAYSADGCGGKNLAPTLLWSNVPTGTKSFAFAILDVSAPVAGGFHHWVVYNIPGSVRQLGGHGQNPYSEGTNDFPHVGYDGPCPPPGGQIHDYVFQLYALNVPNIAGQHLTYQALIQEIAKDVIGVAVTIGTYVNNSPA
jgi:Raf kinase inhibitor-like YbhB/YbcL family protein